MYITIVNKETQEEIDKCQTKQWFEAVQYVEQNKDEYLSTGCSTVIIINKRAKLHCTWELTPDPRPTILNDKSFDKKKKYKNKIKFV